MQITSCSLLENLLFRQPWSWKTSHCECLQIFAASCQESLPLEAHSESLVMCISQALFRSHSMISGFSWARSFSSWWKLEFSSDVVSVFQSPPFNGKACRVSIGCWTGLRAKSLYSCSFLMHVVEIANHQYHPSPSLKFLGWYGLSDTFTKTWSGGLSCVSVVSS